ncbi:bifunctional acetate--CoA ligase family protein/GNAT family N-acetyltransferase [Vibrio hippocampi]|uniref:Peptidyl-lysine N-acetyltransferase Pat n=1 Tax=Vibrio hippocampi TaxID=654686 RepID=A0ABN8DRI5_9VIBR|nr:bifunctional acetate--CoA ligase family protein/GNAT family N-acetyltransferase [Vibrio hippocampi]CAH0529632.1 Peptidyl-lysine N-acetyltransferase Pat [Vibrio hippocampi]
MLLDALLNPNAVAVIGASEQVDHLGHIVMTNLLNSQFKGTILPVHPRHKSVASIYCYASVQALPIKPDLAIICDIALFDQELLQQLHLQQCHSVILMPVSSVSTLTINTDLFQLAQQFGIKLLGPESIGVIAPWRNLNASCSPVSAHPGKLAFIAQSNSVCTTVLDWASERGIGFSYCISLGESYDISFDQLLDYLCRDSHTEAVLLQIDSIQDARKFMSAARAASRKRRILVFKPTDKLGLGKNIVSDLVYDAAIKRAGMLRVYDTHELFAAIETLTHSIPLRGERLAVITNGQATGMMAINQLDTLGGKLSNLCNNTLETLTESLSIPQYAQTPIYVGNSGGIEHYEIALSTLLDSDDVDAILIILCPSFAVKHQALSHRLIEIIHSHPRAKRFNIFTNWTGETCAPSRQLFTQHGIPTYRTPESAVTAFMHLVEYRRNQWQLKETPATIESYTQQQLQSIRAWLEQKTEHSDQSNEMITLDITSSQELLQLAQLPILRSQLAKSAQEAAQFADDIGYPVTVKLASPDIIHKSDVQGVALNLNSAEEVATAVDSIIDRANSVQPDSVILGFIVQPMARLFGTQEIRIKIVDDTVFGPTLFIGQGGSGWRISSQSVVSLLPVNMALSQYLLVQAVNNGDIRFEHSALIPNFAIIAQFLVKLSEMIVACPQIKELDIHPLLIDGNELTILDAAIKIAKFNGESHTRLAIRPYPVEMERVVNLKHGKPVLLRPIKPEDEPLHAEFLTHVTREDLYKRFFSDVGEFDHAALANLTQIDYDREMAFVAIEDFNTPQPQIIGVCRVMLSADNHDGEFGILVRSQLKGHGLGRILMQQLVDYCQQKGTRYLVGMTMPNNSGMLALAKSLGFEIDISFEDGTADMRLTLENQ